MKSLDTSFLERCNAALERAIKLLQQVEQTTIEYEIYRSACIKEFEIILEQSGKLLGKSMKPYFHTSKETDKLVFKDIFRHAALHQIIRIEECERWLLYRDNRNSTTHDYGQGFAESTMKLLPQFVFDARGLLTSISKLKST